MKKSILAVLTSLSLSLILLGCSQSMASEQTTVENTKEAPQKSSEQTAETSEQTSVFDEYGFLKEELAKSVFEDEHQWVLVNKEYGLAADFVPDNLVPIEVPTVNQVPEVNQMSEAASDQLTQLFDAAKRAGHDLYAISGFRSYQTQETLYNNYVAQHGEDEANKFSAQPGHSEHQTGLAMDITSAAVDYGLSQAFGETEEGKWLADNAYRFGFVLSYPQGKEHITGYMYEPWHFRYLGKELAQLLYDRQLTYQEYLAELDIIDLVIHEEMKE